MPPSDHDTSVERLPVIGYAGPATNPTEPWPAKLRRLAFPLSIKIISVVVGLIIGATFAASWAPDPPPDLYMRRCTIGNVQTVPLDQQNAYRNLIQSLYDDMASVSTQPGFVDKVSAEATIIPGLSDKALRDRVKISSPNAFGEFSIECQDQSYERCDAIVNAYLKLGNSSKLLRGVSLSETEAQLSNHHGEEPDAWILTGGLVGVTVAVVGIILMTRYTRGRQSAMLQAADPRFE